MSKNTRLKEHEGASDQGSKSSSSSESSEKDIEVVETSPKGRFLRFNRKLGAGAYKIVYLGFDNDTGREVAWNVISFQHLSKNERKRISEEINIAKSLDHPRIITFINAWLNKQKEFVVFITERVTGGSLRSYVTRLKTNLKIKIIRSWSRQILEGLDYLHSQPHPVIHRDLKCDNIFINGNVGEVLIGDLGLSTSMKNSCATSIVGTPEFMAPELYEEKYGTAVDIYAFGMVLLEMVSRTFPYSECQTAGQIYKQVIAGRKPRVLQRIVDEELRDLVEMCIVLDPGNRPSAKMLLNHPFLQERDDDDGNRIADLMPEQDIPVSNGTPPVTERKSSERSWGDANARPNALSCAIPRSVDHIMMAPKSMTYDSPPRGGTPPFAHDNLPTAETRMDEPVAPATAAQALQALQYASPINRSFNVEQNASASPEFGLSGDLDQEIPPLNLEALSRRTLDIPEELRGQVLHGVAAIVKVSPQLERRIEFDFNTDEDTPEIVASEMLSAGIIDSQTPLDVLTDCIEQAILARAIEIMGIGWGPSPRDQIESRLVSIFSEVCGIQFRAVWHQGIHFEPTPGSETAVLQRCEEEFQVSLPQTMLGKSICQVAQTIRSILPEEKKTNSGENDGYDEECEQYPDDPDTANETCDSKQGRGAGEFANKAMPVFVKDQSPTNHQPVWCNSSGHSVSRPAATSEEFHHIIARLQHGLVELVPSFRRADFQPGVLCDVTWDAIHAFQEHHNLATHDVTDGTFWTAYHTSLARKHDRDRRETNTRDARKHHRPRHDQNGSTAGSRQNSLPQSSTSYRGRAASPAAGTLHQLPPRTNHRNNGRGGQGRQSGFPPLPVAQFDGPIPTSQTQSNATSRYDSSAPSPRNNGRVFHLQAQTPAEPATFQNASQPWYNGVPGSSCDSLSGLRPSLVESRTRQMSRDDRQSPPESMQPPRQPSREPASFLPMRSHVPGSSNDSQRQSRIATPVQSMPTDSVPVDARQSVSVQASQDAQMMPDQPTTDHVRQTTPLKPSVHAALHSSPRRGSFAAPAWHPGNEMVTPHENFSQGSPAVEKSTMTSYVPPPAPSQHKLPMVSPVSSNQQNAGLPRMAISAPVSNCRTPDPQGQRTEQSYVSTTVSSEESGAPRVHRGPGDLAQPVARQCSGENLGMHPHGPGDLAQPVARRCSGENLGMHPHGQTQGNSQQVHGNNLQGRTQQTQPAQSHGFEQPMQTGEQQSMQPHIQLAQDQAHISRLPHVQSQPQMHATPEPASQMHHVSSHGQIYQMQVEQEHIQPQHPHAGQRVQSQPMHQVMPAHAVQQPVQPVHEEQFQIAPSGQVNNEHVMQHDQIVHSQRMSDQQQNQVMQAHVGQSHAPGREFTPSSVMKDVIVQPRSASEFGPSTGTPTDTQELNRGVGLVRRGSIPVTDTQVLRQLEHDSQHFPNPLPVPQLNQNREGSVASPDFNTTVSGSDSSPPVQVHPIPVPVDLSQQPRMMDPVDQQQVSEPGPQKPYMPVQQHLHEPTQLQSQNSIPVQQFQQYQAQDQMIHGQRQGNSIHQGQAPREQNHQLDDAGLNSMQNSVHSSLQQSPTYQQSPSYQQSSSQAIPQLPVPGHHAQQFLSNSVQESNTSQHNQAVVQQVQSVNAHQTGQVVQNQVAHHGQHQEGQNVVQNHTPNLSQQSQQLPQQHVDQRNQQMVHHQQSQHMSQHHGQQPQQGQQVFQQQDGRHVTQQQGHRGSQQQDQQAYHQQQISMISQQQEPNVHQEKQVHHQQQSQEVPPHQQIQLVNQHQQGQDIVQHQHVQHVHQQHGQEVSQHQQQRVQEVPQHQQVQVHQQHPGQEVAQHQQVAEVQQHQQGQGISQQQQQQVQQLHQQHSGQDPSHVQQGHPQVHEIPQQHGRNQGQDFLQNQQGHNVQQHLQGHEIPQPQHSLHVHQKQQVQEISQVQLASNQQQGHHVIQQQHGQEISHYQGQEFSHSPENAHQQSLETNPNQQVPVQHQITQAPAQQQGHQASQQHPGHHAPQQQQPGHQAPQQQQLGHQAPQQLQPGHQAPQQQQGHPAPQQQPGHQALQQQQSHQVPQQQQPGHQAPQQQPPGHQVTHHASQQHPGHHAPQQQHGAPAPHQQQMSQHATHQHSGHHATHQQQDHHAPQQQQQGHQESQQQGQQPMHQAPQQQQVQHAPQQQQVQQASQQQQQQVHQILQQQPQGQQTPQQQSQGQQTPLQQPQSQPMPQQPQSQPMPQQQNVNPVYQQQDVQQVGQQPGNIGSQQLQLQGTNQPQAQQMIQHQEHHNHQLPQSQHIIKQDQGQNVSQMQGHQLAQNGQQVSHQNQHGNQQQFVQQQQSAEAQQGQVSSLHAPQTNQRVSQQQGIQAQHPQEGQHLAHQQVQQAPQPQADQSQQMNQVAHTSPPQQGHQAPQHTQMQPPVQQHEQISQHPPVNNVIQQSQVQHLSPPQTKPSQQVEQLSDQSMMQQPGSQVISDVQLDQGITQQQHHVHAPQQQIPPQDQIMLHNQTEQVPVQQTVPHVSSLQQATIQQSMPPQSVAQQVPQPNQSVQQDQSVSQGQIAEQQPTSQLIHAQQVQAMPQHQQMQAQQQVQPGQQMQYQHEQQIVHLQEQNVQHPPQHHQGRQQHGQQQHVSQQGHQMQQSVPQQGGQFQQIQQQPVNHQQRTPIAQNEQSQPVQQNHPVPLAHQQSLDQPDLQRQQSPPQQQGSLDVSRHQGHAISQHQQTQQVQHEGQRVGQQAVQQSQQIAPQEPGAGVQQESVPHVQGQPMQQQVPQENIMHQHGSPSHQVPIQHSHSSQSIPHQSDTRQSLQHGMQLQEQSQQAQPQVIQTDLHSQQMTRQSQQTTHHNPADNLSSSQVQQNASMQSSSQSLPRQQDDLLSQSMRQQGHQQQYSDQIQQQILQHQSQQVTQDQHRNHQFAQHVQQSGQHQQVQQNMVQQQPVPQHPQVQQHPQVLQQPTQQHGQQQAQHESGQHSNGVLPQQQVSPVLPQAQPASGHGVDKQSSLQRQQSHTPSQQPMDQHRPYAQPIAQPLLRSQPSTQSQTSSQGFESMQSSQSMHSNQPIQPRVQQSSGNQVHPPETPPVYRQHETPQMTQNAPVQQPIPVQPIQAQPSVQQINTQSVQATQHQPLQGVQSHNYPAVPMFNQGQQDYSATQIQAPPEAQETVVSLHMGDLPMRREDLGISESDMSQEISNQHSQQMDGGSVHRFDPSSSMNSSICAESTFLELQGQKVSTSQMIDSSSAHQNLHPQNAQVQQQHLPVRGNHSEDDSQRGISMHPQDASKQEHFPQGSDQTSESPVYQTPQSIQHGQPSTQRFVSDRCAECPTSAHHQSIDSHMLANSIGSQSNRTPASVMDCVPPRQIPVSTIQEDRMIHDNSHQIPPIPVPQVESPRKPIEKSVAGPAPGLIRHGSNDTIDQTVQSPPDSGTRPDAHGPVEAVDPKIQTMDLVPMAETMRLPSATQPTNMPSSSSFGSLSGTLDRLQEDLSSEVDKTMQSHPASKTLTPVDSRATSQELCDSLQSEGVTPQQRKPTMRDSLEQLQELAMQMLVEKKDDERPMSKEPAVAPTVRSDPKLPPEVVPVRKLPSEAEKALEQFTELSLKQVSAGSGCSPTTSPLLQSSAPWNTMKVPAESDETEANETN